MNMMTELSRRASAARVLNAKMRIAGERGRRRSRVIEVRNPYTDALVGTVPKATVDDIRRAFAIARAYRPKLTPLRPLRILRNGGRR